MRRLALLLLAAACSNSPSPIPAESFGTRYVEAVCSAQARCDPRASYVNDACRAAQARVLGEDVPKGLAAGRLTYDAQKASECIDALESVRCIPEGTASPDVSACLLALKGTVAEGADCHSLFECQRGLCTPEIGGTCPVRCPHVLDAGAPCNAHGEPFCDARQGLVCIEATCRKVQPSGGACTLNAECQTGLFCSGGVCSGLRRAGAGCSGDESCAPGLFCAGGGDEATGQCVQRAGEGSTCGEGELTGAAQRGAECAEGFACKGAGLTTAGDPIEGKCAPFAALGEACLVEAAGLQGQVSGCVAGLICVDGACAEPPKAGEACAAHETCHRPDAYCDPATNLCGAVRAEGAACEHDYECGAPGHECSNGACVSTSPFCHEG